MQDVACDEEDESIINLCTEESGNSDDIYQNGEE